FHSFALVGSGLYLAVMGAAGLYLRQIQGAWGPTLQIVFLIGSVSILAVIFSSGALRARTKHFISMNFFSLKYDYRQTWMQFVQALSSTDHKWGLQRRLLNVVMDLMESTAGGLWIRSDDEAVFSPCASSKLGSGLASEPLGSPFEDWLTQHKTVIEL